MTEYLSIQFVNELASILVILMSFAEEKVKVWNYKKVWLNNHRIFIFW